MSFKTKAIPLITGAVEYVLDKVLTEENYQQVGDMVFDFIEDLIVKTENKLDDKLLPWISKVRKITNLPDLPDK